jgi:hypothetical protein
MDAIADGSIHCVATSPPYWGLRSYLAKDDPAKASEIGSEPTPDGYVASMVAVGREVRRVLREDGTWWLNLGDGYAANVGMGHGGRHAQGDKWGGTSADKRGIGLPPKSLLLMPFRVALALQADGWILRAAIPWVKHGTCMPESVQDRPTTAHETVFLLARSERYYFDADAVRVGAQIRTESAAPIRRQTEGGTDRRRMGGGDDGLGVNPAGRNIRTSDFHATSLDAIEADLASYLTHVRHARAAGGLLLTPEGSPSAFLVNPVPSPYKHFAMWPPALVKPMILASTSERGCCPACGAGWRRVVERGAIEVHPVRGGHQPPRMRVTEAGDSRSGIDGSSLGMDRKRTDLGFAPSCSCPPAPPVPCTVLDPFAGTSTTLRVADDLGRHAVGYELNAAYLPIGAERTAQQGLFSMSAKESAQ